MIDPDVKAALEAPIRSSERANGKEKLRRTTEFLDGQIDLEEAIANAKKDERNDEDQD